MGKIKNTTDNASEITKLNKLVPQSILKSKKKSVKNNDTKKQLRTKKNINTENPKEKKTKGPSRIDIQQFERGIDVLLQYEDKNKSKDLFNREKPVFLQIQSVKIPICPRRRIRITLKHSLLMEKQEVCLIVPDLKRGRNIDHEPTIEHYEDLLRSKNVTLIKRILPIRQLRVEYDQFELKRRLCGYYDHFLVAGSISGHVLHLLGKIFIEKRKTPIPIKLESNNLNKTIETALKKTSLTIHSEGSSFIVQFGHSEMTVDQLKDNIRAVVKQIMSEFPGGWLNVQSLHIKTDKSIAIPIYYSLRNPNTVNVPVIKPIRPKSFSKITDELTTISSRQSDVTVHPGGRIEYNKKEIGLSKNQLRKVRQGKIKKQKEKILAKKQKLKTKNLKLKKDIAEEVKTEIKEEKTSIPQLNNKIKIELKKSKKQNGENGKKRKENKKNE